MDLPARIEAEASRVQQLATQKACEEYVARKRAGGDTSVAAEKDGPIWKHYEATYACLWSDYFKPLTTLQPEACDMLKDSLANIAGTAGLTAGNSAGAVGGRLQTAKIGKETVASIVAPWDGRAITTFRRNVLDHHSQRVDNQVMLGQVLVTAMEAYKEVLLARLEDALNLAKTTAVVLESYEPAGSGGGEALKTRFTMSSVAYTASAGVFALPDVTASAPKAAVRLATIGVAASATTARTAASRQQAGPVTEYEISGDTVFGILNSMCEAIGRLNGDFQRADGAMAEQLASITKALTGELRQSFVSPRSDELVNVTGDTATKVVTWDDD